MMNKQMEKKAPLTVRRQYYLPQHALSRFAGLLSHCKINWVKNYLIQWFLDHYPVNMDEAILTDPKAYRCYHDLFIRKLKPEARPIDPTERVICSPCDGTISQMGQIQAGTLLQAKGHSFTLASLLGDAAAAQPFANGHYLTAYLAPQDYHRVHMPYAGKLKSMHYLPGKLFSVNPLTAQSVENLFSKNERVVAFFDHPKGPFAMVLVGAMIVGSISTTWAGTIAPSKDPEIRKVVYPQTPTQYLAFNKGDEMGYFSLGSTVIIIFADNISWEYNLSQDSRLVVGQRIGQFLP